MERMTYMGHKYVDFFNEKDQKQIKGVQVYFMAERPDRSDCFGIIPEKFWYTPQQPMYTEVSSWKPMTVFDLEFGRGKSPLKFYPVKDK